MNKKNVLSKILFKNNILSNILSSRGQNNIHILAYHRITENVPDNYKFNTELFSATLEDFDLQMKYVSENYNVINFEQLENRIESNTVEKNTLLITFDDGYYDNYSLALPILKKYNLTATVFLATDNIDSGDFFWFDIAAGFFKNTPNVSFDLESINEKFDFSVISRHKAFKRAGSIIRNSDDSVRVAFLSEVRDRYGYEISQDDYNEAKPLTWNNVIEMSDQNIEFGSHSKSHCFLNRITDEQLFDEIIGSKQVIESKLNKTMFSFCYPAGVNNAHIQDVVQSAGYCFGVGYRHGTNVAENINRYNLIRKHVELDVTYELFKANLALPEVFMRFKG